MKKLFLVILLLLVIAAAGIFVFILTFDVNQYKPILIEKIEGAIDKDVNIGNISLNLVPGLAVRIDGVSIKDRDKGWTDVLLKAGSIETRVKLLPLIKKDIQIERLNIRGLAVMLTKEDLLRPSESIDTGLSEDIDVGSAAIGALTFLVESVSIVDSSVSYEDARIDIIEAVLKNISRYGPIHVDADLSLFGRGSGNIKLKALLYPELETKAPYVKNLDVKIDMARFDLRNALNALGQKDIAQQLIGKEIKGDLAISSEKIYLDPEKIYDSRLYVDLSKGATDALPIKGGLQDIELTAEMSGGDILIQNLTGLLAEASFTVRGAITDISSAQLLKLDIALQNINVSDLLPEYGPGRPHLEGRLNVNLSASAGDLSGPGLLGTLVADGTLRLDKAVLQNINILEAALDKLNMLPGLVYKLKTNLPERYKKLLRERDTIFQPIETRFNIENRRLFLPRVEIESDAFYLIGSGYVDLDRSVSISSDIFIPQDLSYAFIDVVREFEYLQNREGMITMPLSISGRLPDISVRPDLEYVIQRLAVSKGQELLEDFFEKKLPRIPKEKIPGPTPGPEGEAQPQEKEPEEVEPAEAIIRSIFDIITSPKK